MTDPVGRARARRHFAGWCALFAVVLLVGGFALTRGDGSSHDIGTPAVGYGIGVAVAAGFLASGWETSAQEVSVPVAL